jgi:hypothetical protein
LATEFQAKAAQPKPMQSFKTFNTFEDNQFRDKFGFQSEDISLSDAFSFD